MGLTQHQVEQFADQGYLILPGLIAEERRTRYVALFDELVERSRSLPISGGGFHLAFDDAGQPIPGVLHKVQGVAVVEPRVLEIAAEPGVVAAVSALLGPDLDVFGTKFYPMNVAGATSTGWHQDNHYFGTRSDRVVSCAIYFHDTDAANGCLRVAPGTHRAGELVQHQRGDGIYSHGAWTPVADTDAVDVVCPAGTVVLFSANLLHGARPNCSGRPSYRTAWHYIPADLDLELFRRGQYEDRHWLGACNGGGSED